MGMLGLNLTWVSSDTVFLSQRLSFAVSIDFGNDNLVFGVRKSICELFVNRSQVLIGQVSCPLLI